MEAEQQTISVELVEGEPCEVCGCLAESHNLDGCEFHPQCFNFYRYHDFEYLAEDW